MVNFVSPGTFIIEKDVSEYAPTVDSSIVGILGFATKGPVNEATLITNTEQLVNTFGEPSETITGQGLEGAIEILEATNQIYYVRAASSTAVEASSYINFGASPAMIISANGFGVTSNLYLQVQVYNHAGVAQFAEPQVFSIPSGTIDQSLSAPYQAVALRKVIGGSIDSDKVGIFWDADTSNQLSGYLVGSWAGSGASISVSSASGTDFTSQAISALVNINTAGDASATAVSHLRVFGYSFDTAAATTSSIEYFAETLYPGAGYNLGTKTDGSTSGVSIEIDSLGGANFSVIINDKGVAAESFKVSFLENQNHIEDAIVDDLTNATSDFILGSITFSGAAASPSKLTSFTNKISTFGTDVNPKASSRNSTTDGSIGVAVTGNYTPRFIKLIEGTYGLANGTNGIPSNNAGLATVLIGTTQGSTKTGMNLLDNDLLGISIAAVPGITIQEVQNALITLAETTQEFLAVVSPPIGLDTVQEAINWSNGQSQTRTAAINSNFAAVFWPEVKVFSVFDGIDRWYDPSIFAVRQMCVTDNLAEPWFAPAGFRRGRVTKPTQVAVPLSQGDRDSMYSGGNIINPIVNFPQQGIVIFGQRTAQRLPSALDRINVRRLMIFVRKILIQTTRPFIFEPNDEFLWQQIEETLNPFLDDIKRRRGLIDFRTVVDSTTNTPARVDRNELWAKIILQPTKAAEILIMEVNLTNTGEKLGL